MTPWPRFLVLLAWFFLGVLLFGAFYIACVRPYVG